MVIGIMEVKLVGAKGLKNTDFLGGIDPYVLLQYRKQECKSTIAKGKGTSPVWNEKFEFRVDSPFVDDNQYKLVLKIMDHDTFSADDYLGQATIYVEDLIKIGVEKGEAELHLKNTELSPPIKLIMERFKLELLSLQREKLLKKKKNMVDGRKATTSFSTGYMELSACNILIFSE